MTPIHSALILTFAMGLVIFFCRGFPFLLFRGKEVPPEKTRLGTFLAFVEKTVPPVAMTVLAFNSLSVPLKDAPQTVFPALIAAGLTALVHLWKRNTLLSILGGTGVYMALLYLG